MASGQRAVRSEFLRASAGTGKTYALSMRYCTLLMAGVPPETICALTFTRAATREIFQAVVERLVKGEAPSVPGGLTHDEALEKLLQALPKLQISTIDAFSARIARLFAYELELDPDFSLYEEGDSAEGRAVSREVVRRAMRATSETSAESLAKRFSAERRYMDDASIVKRLNAFLSQYGALYESHPEGWGDLDALAAASGEKEPVHKLLSKEERDEMLARFNELTKRVDCSKLARSVPTDYTHRLGRFPPDGASIYGSRSAGLFTDANLEHLQTLQEKGKFKGRGKDPLVLDALAQKAAYALREDLYARDCQQTAAYTASLGEALRALHRAGEQYRQETGKIGFTQLTHALCRTIQQAGRALSFVDPDKLYVAYRMDAAVRHLMIDEFQDTSREQWGILSSLAYELAQDAEGSRTFFYVGDVKQSIYGWRGGDATLFADTSRVPAIAEGKALTESRRSCPDVIGFINRTMDFSGERDQAFEAHQLPVIRRWNKAWQPHTAYDKSRRGYVRFEVLDGRLEEVWTAAADIIAERWQELRACNLRLAVLAIDNGTLETMHHLLRARGVPCAIDGKRFVSETVLGQLVLQLLHWLADPRATRWGEVARQCGVIDSPDAETLTRWVATIAEGGYVAWLESCFGAPSLLHGKLSACDLEAYEAIRLCLEAVDKSGSVDPLEARDAVEHYAMPSMAGGGVINLMTVHHSKGLTFDVVFTLLKGNFRHDKTCESGAGWVMAPPTFSASFDAYDAFADAMSDRKTLRFMDDLCTLYVAITRARSEQWVLAPRLDNRRNALGNTSTRVGLLSRHFAETRRDGVLYSSGLPGWWRDIASEAPPAPEPEPAFTETPWQVLRGEKPPEVELPSEQVRPRTVEELLSGGGAKARRAGIALHARLAAVAWTSTPPDGLFPEVFREPSEPCELWRERTFSVRIPEQGRFRYMAGQFDRVHIFPASHRAVIYDFKTSRLPEVTPAYARQLRDYRLALSILTGIPESAIRMVLLFTHARQALEVPNG